MAPEGTFQKAHHAFAGNACRTKLHTWITVCDIDKAQGIDKLYGNVRDHQTCNNFKCILYLVHRALRAGEICTDGVHGVVEGIRCR